MRFSQRRRCADRAPPSVVMYAPRTDTSADQSQNAAGTHALQGHERDHLVRLAREEAITPAEFAPALRRSGEHRSRRSVPRCVNGSRVVSAPPLRLLATCNAERCGTGRALQGGAPPREQLIRLAVGSPQRASAPSAEPRQGSQPTLRVRPNRGLAGHRRRDRIGHRLHSVKMMSSTPSRPRTTPTSPLIVKRRRSRTQIHAGGRAILPPSQQQCHQRHAGQYSQPRPAVSPTPAKAAIVAA